MDQLWKRERLCGRRLRAREARSLPLRCVSIYRLVNAVSSSRCLKLPAQICTSETCERAIEHGARHRAFGLGAPWNHRFATLCVRSIVCAQTQDTRQRAREHTEQRARSICGAPARTEFNWEVLGRILLEAYFRLVRLGRVDLERHRGSKKKRWN